MKKLNYNFRFFALQAFYWASYCSVYAFIGNILSLNGYSNVLCGFVLSGISLGSIAVQFILGYIVDTFFPSKRVMIFLMGIAGVLSLLIPKAMSSSVPLTIASLILMSLLDYSLYVTIDVWTVASMEKHPEVQYSLTRTGGSLGYAVAALILGVVIVQIGTDVLFLIHSVFLLISILFCLCIEEVPCRNKKGSTSRTEDKSLSLLQVGKILVKNKPYMLLLVIITIMQFSFRPVSAYLYLAVNQAGGDSSHQGIAILLGSGLEVIGILVSQRLKKNGVHFLKILSLGMLCGAIRMATLLLPLGIWGFIILQSFKAFAYGAYLCVFTEYISTITPRKISASATTIATAVCDGLGTMVGNLLGGYIIDGLGLPFFEILCGVGFLMCFVLSLLSFHLFSRPKETTSTCFSGR